MQPTSRKTPRQPNDSTPSSTGQVALIAPRPPNARYQPLTTATRSRGNQATIAFSAAIRPPETPRPIRARAARRPLTPSLIENNSAPIPATAYSVP